MLCATQALFQMASRTTPPLRFASPQPPACSLFRHALSGPGLREASCHPAGFSTCGLAPRSEEEGRESVGCLSWARSYANMPPRPRVSPGMCPGLQAPSSLHSSRCGQPSLRVQAGGVGETIGLGSGGCPGRALALRPQLEGCGILPTPRVGVLSNPALLRGSWRKHIQPEATWHSLLEIKEKDSVWWAREKAM